MPCWLLRAESESFFESFFESPSKANTYGIAGTVRKAPKPSARLTVKVVPGSSRDGIVGWLGDALKIKVTAPPEKGRANEAVVSLLCERLGLPADAVTVVSGHSSPSKVIAINGMDDEAIKKAFIG